jgi:hypothetical protein
VALQFLLLELVAVALVLRNLQVMRPHKTCHLLMADTVLHKTAILVLAQVLAQVLNQPSMEQPHPTSMAAVAVDTDPMSHQLRHRMMVVAVVDS